MGGVHKWGCMGKERRSGGGNTQVPRPMAGILYPELRVKVRPSDIIGGVSDGGCGGGGGG